MKKNNIYMYKPNLKTKFRRSLAKKKIKLTPKKSQLQLRVRASFVCRRSFTPYSFLSTIPYFSFVRYFLLCHVNNNKSRVSFQREESGQLETSNRRQWRLFCRLNWKTVPWRTKARETPTMHTRDFETSLSFSHPLCEQTRCRRSRASWQLSTFPPIGDSFVTSFSLKR